MNLSLGVKPIGRLSKNVRAQARYTNASPCILPLNLAGMSIHTIVSDSVGIAGDVCSDEDEGGFKCAGDCISSGGGKLRMIGVGGLDIVHSCKPVIARL